MCHAGGFILASLPIDHLDDKGEAELTVAPVLIAQLDWHGRVLTGDARYGQRELCQQVRAAGGDYLFLVKANQPELYDDIHLLFDPPLAAPPLDDRREAWTVAQGHGRYDDTRHLVASTDLTDDSDWPDIQQVFRLERSWWDWAGTHHRRHYGITSLPPAVASPARLLALRRGRWTIENRSFYVKDVALGEEAATVRLGTAPTIRVLARDLALNALRQAGYHTVTARL